MNPTSRDAPLSSPLVPSAPASPEERIDSPAIELSDVKQRRVAVQLVLAIASFLTVMIATSAEALTFPVIAIASLLWMLGPGRSLVAPVWKRPFQLKPGTVTRWNDALVVRAGEKQEILRSAQITDVRLRPLEEKIELVLDTGKTATITAPAFDKIAALLDVTGLPPEKRTYVARLGEDRGDSRIAWISSIAGSASLVLGLGLVFGAGAPAMALWLVPLLATIAFFLIRTRTDPGEIAIGPMGVTLGRATHRRFFHYGGLRGVQLDPSRLRLLTDDGQEVSAGIEGLDTPAREMIEGWVNDRRLAFAISAAGTDAFAVLDRQGRSLEAWRAALKTVLSEPGQYRRAPISADDLSRLLTNPHTTAERRIAAAFILSEGRTVTTQKQIRFAAESSSSQPMRIALRALAEEKLEADAIEEAIAAETGAGAR